MRQVFGVGGAQPRVGGAKGRHGGVCPLENSLPALRTPGHPAGTVEWSQRSSRESSTGTEVAEK